MLILFLMAVCHSQLLIAGELSLIPDIPAHHSPLIVNTGIKVNQISVLQLTSSSYILDFEVWFRYPASTWIDPGDIVFLNALSPVHKLPSPLLKKREGMIYQVQHFKGEFQILSVPQLTLGIQFRHQILAAEEIIYQVEKPRGNDDNFQQQLFEQLKLVVHSVQDWQLYSVKLFEGNHHFLRSLPFGLFSQVNLQIQLQKKRSYHLISGQMALILAPFFILGIFFLILFKKLISEIFFEGLLFLNNCLLLMSLEIIFVNILSLSFSQIEQGLDLFDVGKWLLIAYFINRLLRHNYSRLVNKNQFQFPIWLYWGSDGLVYYLALLGILSFVYSHSSLSCALTLLIVPMIMGLAFYSKLLHLISGMMLNWEKPYQVGDWVKIGDFEEGRVVRLTWRITELKLSEGGVLHLPNYLVISCSIKQLHQVDHQLHWQEITVQITTTYSPNRVESILLAIISQCPNVCHLPPPFISSKEVTTGKLDCSIHYCMENYGEGRVIQQQVLKQIAEVFQDK